MSISFVRYLLLASKRCTAYQQSSALLCNITARKLNCEASSAFCISTIVLAVKNSSLKSDLDSFKTTTTMPPTTSAPVVPSFRLPKTVKPVHYDLTLKPNLVSQEFSGSVTISVSIQEDTDAVFVNNNKLNIRKVTVDGIDGSFNVDTAVEQVKIWREGQRFKAGQNVKVFIEFSGSLKDRIVGFYSSSYITEDGTPKMIATSKFEPTYARQAFPCFDEPNLKAKYTVHLLIPKENGYHALSNNPIEKTEDVEGGKLVTFMETVPMPTYLTCFIVSDFISTNYSFTSGKKVPFNVWATPAQLEKTTYAGEVGIKVMEMYTGYFGIEYPLPKLDMVAIPDFVSGAMEHWGLVTYRETALLYSDKTHSVSNKQRVATVVAHELAHSWFGNYVTMDWWSDLWLNEGFASYIEYKGVDAAEPSWKMLDQFLIDDLHSVLSLDATLASRKIIKNVETPDQITEVFDAISYNKGASILRMLENTVGEKNFQKGITNYLNKYKFGNAITQNLWDELQKVVEQDPNLSLDVTAFMGTFTEQMGYPVLKVEIEGNTFKFTQQRFLKDPEATYNSTDSKYGYRWTVPITYVTDLDSKTDSINSFKALMKYDDQTVSIEKPPEAKWIKFNHHQVGYYRVLYPENYWSETLINFYQDLHVADRAHLIEESFRLAEAGLLTYTVPLNFTQKLNDEYDYVPLSAAYSQITSILQYVKDTDYEAKFKNYLKKVIENAYKKYSWNVEVKEHLEKLSQIVVLSLACSVGHETCLEEAQKKFTAWINNPTELLDPNLKNTIFKYGIKGKTVEDWEKMYSLFVKELDANEKLKLMNGLASIDNREILEQFLERGWDETVVRRQDYFTFLAYISANPKGTDLIWDYVRNKWEDFVDRFTLNERYLGNMIPTVTSSFKTEQKLNEMKEFFAKYPDAGAGKAARGKAIENVQNNINWLKRYKTTVEDWIDSVSV